MHCTSLNALLVAASLVTTTIATPIFPRTAPNIPTAAAAKTALAALTVAAQGPQTGYSRDLFPTCKSLPEFWPPLSNIDRHKGTLSQEHATRERLS